ncbi:LysE family translocator [Vreelandella subglaciescola]|uniref:Threonine/homoserine/homoserine lactone efflux protein n=1 Tax=Vreelandella subglaciescola TaxID=29571 RepID=A0A1M7FUN3_9GAMM|nr:LysE family transporter [Halomonas subglaciescola]SHM07743.1 Threonine/homoserine/homoserine lactone efflux protein [Halomonas subglaciescola]
MPFSLWLSLAAICTVGAMSPGPSLALVLRHTLGGGRLPGVTAGLFHALGVGFYALLTVLGLGALMARFPLLFEIVSIGGAVYLAWLGVKALRAGKAAALTPEAAVTTRRQAAREGVLVALANPKLILFFVALLSQFVNPEMSVAARAIIVVTAMVIDASWYVLVAVALSQSRVLEWLRARSHWINRITGVMLIGLALRVAWGLVA